MYTSVYIYIYIYIYIHVYISSPGFRVATVSSADDHSSLMMPATLLPSAAVKYTFARPHTLFLNFQNKVADGCEGSEVRPKGTSTWHSPRSHHRRAYSGVLGRCTSASSLYM